MSTSGPHQAIAWQEVKAGKHAPSGRGGASVCELEGKLYVFGGSNREATHFNDLHCFNSATSEWEAITPTGDIPPAMSGSSATAHKGKLYLFGGLNLVKEITYNSLYTFSPDSCKWEKVKAQGEAPAARNSHSAFVWNNGLYIFGGSCPTTGPRNDFHCLDLDTLEWKEVVTEGVKPRPREMAASFLFSDTKPAYFVVYGGRDGDGKVLSDVCTLDLTTMQWAAPADTGHRRCAGASATVPAATAAAEEKSAEERKEGRENGSHVGLVFGGWDGGMGIFDDVVVLRNMGKDAPAWKSEVCELDGFNGGVCFGQTGCGIVKEGKPRLAVFGGISFEKDFDRMLLIAPPQA